MCLGFSVLAKEDLIICISFKWLCTCKYTAIGSLRAPWDSDRLSSVPPDLSRACTFNLTVQNDLVLNSPIPALAILDSQLKKETKGCGKKNPSQNCFLCVTKLTNDQIGQVEVFILISYPVTWAKEIKLLRAGHLSLMWSSWKAKQTNNNNNNKRFIAEQKADWAYNGVWQWKSITWKHIDPAGWTHLCGCARIKMGGGPPEGSG